MCTYHQEAAQKVVFNTKQTLPLDVFWGVLQTRSINYVDIGMETIIRGNRPGTTPMRACSGIDTVRFRGGAATRTRGWRVRLVEIESSGARRACVATWALSYAIICLIVIAMQPINAMLLIVIDCLIIRGTAMCILLVVRAYIISGALLQCLTCGFLVIPNVGAAAQELWDWIFSDEMGIPLQRVLLWTVSAIWNLARDVREEWRVRDSVRAKERALSDHVSDDLAREILKFAGVYKEADLYLRRTLSSEARVPFMSGLLHNVLEDGFSPPTHTPQLTFFCIELSD